MFFWLVSLLMTFCDYLSLFKKSWFSWFPSIFITLKKFHTVKTFHECHSLIAANNLLRAQQDLEAAAMGDLGVIGFNDPRATGHGPLATCHGPFATCHGPLRGRCHVASGLCKALRGKRKWSEARKWPEKSARKQITMDFWWNSLIFGIEFSRNF